MNAESGSLDKAITATAVVIDLILRQNADGHD
jgi:hypothetical protein